MVKFKCSLGGLVADADHKLAAHDPGEHVPSQKEGKATEHLAFGHRGVGRHVLAGAVGEILVVGRQASRRPGRPKKRSGQTEPVISNHGSAADSEDHGSGR